MQQTLYPDYQPIKRNVISDLIEYSNAVEKIVTARYISVRDITAITSIPDTPEAYHNILNDVCELTTTPLTPAHPQSSMLLVNDIWTDIKNRSVIVQNIKFNSIFRHSIGGAGKTASEVNDYIIDSLKTTNNAIPQSQFYLSPNVSFIPNWFFPVVRANGNNIFGVEKTNPSYDQNEATNNKGLFAFGNELPFYIDINKQYINIKTLEVYASLYNALEFPDGIFYQRYPLTCEISLLVLK
jgi:hypothetical protein